MPFDRGLVSLREETQRADSLHNVLSVRLSERFRRRSRRLAASPIVNKTMARRVHRRGHSAVVGAASTRDRKADSSNETNSVIVLLSREGSKS